MVQWRGGPVWAKGSQIKLDEALRIMPTIEVFLSKYPLEVTPILGDIFLLRTLSLYGLDCGSSDGAIGIYIASEEGSDGTTNDELLREMHARDANMLYRLHDFPAQKWHEVNDREWKYIGHEKVRELLLRAGPHDEPDDLLRRGFLDEYSQAGIEQDFTTYAAFLFERRAFLESAAAKHPRVRQKTELAMSFYESIHPGFTFQEHAKLASEPKGERSREPKNPKLPDGSQNLAELPDDVFASTPSALSADRRRRDHSPHHVDKRYPNSTQIAVSGDNYHPLSGRAENDRP